MRYIIPINYNTLPLIAGLNGGAEPHFEGQTYFIYDPDPNGENDIVSDQKVWAAEGLVDRTFNTFRVMPLMAD